MNDSVTKYGSLQWVALASRRQKLALGGVLLLLPAALATYEMGLTGKMGLPASLIKTGSSLAAAITGAPSELLEELRLRSPGQRSKGELADSKGHAGKRTRAHGPHERALAKVRLPGGTPLPLGPAIAQIAEGLPPVGLPDAGGLLPSIGVPIPGSPGLLTDAPPGGSGGGGGGGGIIGGGGGGVIGGGGGGGAIGGGPGGGDGGPPPGPPPVTSPVPEPSTWALMMIGFGGIGWSLRRKRRPLSVPTSALGAVATAQ